MLDSSTRLPLELWWFATQLLATPQATALRTLFAGGDSGEQDSHLDGLSELMQALPPVHILYRTRTIHYCTYLVSVFSPRGTILKFHFLFLGSCPEMGGCVIIPVL